MRLKSLLALTGLACFTLTGISPSHATEANLMPNYFYKIDVVRTDTAKNEDFKIRLTSPSAVTGCYEAKPATYEIVDAGAVLYVKLEESNLALNTKPSYGHFECSLNTGSAYTDIAFNTNQLTQNNTYKIEIKSDTVGKLFDVKVEPGDDKLTLHTELKTPVRLPASEMKKTHNFWYYPDNSVVLSTPGLGTNTDEMEKLKAFALGRGLTPMHETLDGFPAPLSNDKELFYVDHKKLFQDNLKSDKPTIVGSISTTEQAFGPQGAYDKPKKVSVFARAIGVND